MSEILVGATVYELVREDLTNLGGRMGTEFTTSRRIGVFSDVDKAKEYAGLIYSKQCGGEPEREIKWKKTGKFSYSSNDLRFVMYNINVIKIM